MTTQIFESLDECRIAAVFEQLEMHDYLDNLHLEKVIKLYFYYRSTGNIQKMALMLQEYKQEKMHLLMNRFKKMKHGLDSLIEGFQQLETKTMTKFFNSFLAEKNKQSINLLIK